MNKKEPYTPPKEILKKYAEILVNFALGSGKGIKKGEVVRIVAWESAKPLFVEIRKAVLRAGGHFISHYMPDDDDRFNLSRDFYDYANTFQLEFFPGEYMKGLVRQIDHQVIIISEAHKHALHNIDPKKIMKASNTMKPYRSLLDKKENRGEFTWTLALYGTKAMAVEAKMTEREYWNQIIKACFLDKSNPISFWKKTYKEIGAIEKKLNRLSIDKLHIKGPDADLWIKMSSKSHWISGRGRNIPSFEIFTSPDCMGTEGWIRFNQPLYRYGNRIEGIELKFVAGKVVKAKAKKNEKLLKEMIASSNANKVGEYSLTDSRHSRITRFMAETLFDENIGGIYGNTHLALGQSYADCYNVNAATMKKSDWKKLGFNESPVHTDIISTTKRTVTAHLNSGKEKIIYKDGHFLV